MAVNRFVLNGVSYHGHGAIKEIPGIVKSKGFKKAFVASDPDLVKFGVTAKVTDLLKENGIDFEVYSDIKPNPTIENVQSGVAAYKASGADFMIIKCVFLANFSRRKIRHQHISAGEQTLFPSFRVDGT